eukprot:GHVQ01018655.1.p1 GENE.GHVQ01018655.1~~GHVQ01018655.1.p1  ORF type:complete len:279 (+),score=57.06 GHVQ01018655.1:645-1481(+)
MLFVDTRKVSVVLSIWLVAVGTLVFVWGPLEDGEVKEGLWLGQWREMLMPLRFGAIKDIGITIYLMIVMEWSLLRLPMSALAPAFFADPIAAIVGSYATPRIPLYPGAHKTLFGSLAAFLTAYACMYLYNDFDLYEYQQWELRQKQRLEEAHAGGAVRGGEEGRPQQKSGHVQGGEGVLRQRRGMGEAPSMDVKKKKMIEESVVGGCEGGERSDVDMCDEIVVGVSVWYKVIVSIACCGMEAMGGAMDNLMLSVPAILGWVGYHALHWGAWVSKVPTV